MAFPDEKPSIPNDKSPNTAKPPVAEKPPKKTLAQFYAEQQQLKLNKYPPADKAHIMANWGTDDPKVRAFMELVAEWAEHEFDKQETPAPVPKEEQCPCQCGHGVMLHDVAGKEHKCRGKDCTCKKYQPKPLDKK
jgi:hypothetical protein